MSLPMRSGYGLRSALSFARRRFFTPVRSSMLFPIPPILFRHPEAPSRLTKRLGAFAC